MRTRSVAILTCISVTVALPGLAMTGACPTADDLAQGIRAEYADGSWSEYRAVASGEVEITESANDAARSQFVLRSRHGLYDLSATSVPVGDGVVLPEVVTNYSIDAADLPVPQPETVWTGLATFSSSEGVSETMSVVYVFGRAEQAEIGGCTYDRVNVKASYLGEQSWMWQEFTYFTGLGFGALMASQTEGETEAFEGALVGLVPVAAP